MLKLIHIEYRQEYEIYCEFTDNMAGLYDLEPLLWSRDTQVTVPLRDKTSFRKFFLRSGALCWSNGLELDPQAIHMELASAGKLSTLQKAA